jgi:exodeoxyribonuclease-3
MNTLRLATWNVNSLRVRLPQLWDWLDLTEPEGGIQLMGLQETKTEDAAFPWEDFESCDWHVAHHGQKTYNGVALVSREPLSDVVRNLPGLEDEQARVITATTLGLRVICAYFPNGQAPDSDKFQYKLRWLDALKAHVRDQLAQHPRLVLMGDFNITRDDNDVYDPVELAGTIHCTDIERQAFSDLLDLGFHDALRLFHSEPQQFSWWDYRAAAFRRNRGLRIDHVLVSEALKPEASDCVIDKRPRTFERPSDHTPVVLSLVKAP